MADVTEVDYTTDPPTIIERDFTAEELAQREADLAAWEAQEAERVAAVEAAAAARESAVGKLKKLGLTDDEVSALIGGVA